MNIKLKARHKDKKNFETVAILDNENRRIYTRIKHGGIRKNYYNIDDCEIKIISNVIYGKDSINIKA